MFRVSWLDHIYTTGPNELKCKHTRFYKYTLIHIWRQFLNAGYAGQVQDLPQVKDKSILFPDITFLKHIGLKHFLLKGQFHHEYDIGPTTFLGYSPL